LIEGIEHLDGVGLPDGLVGKAVPHGRKPPAARLPYGGNDIAAPLVDW
jgi:hypothetical protein